MKIVHRTLLVTISFAIALLWTGIFLMGCSSDSDDPETVAHVPVTGNFEVDMEQNAAARYYSFSTGEWVTDPKSQAWDVGFVRPRTILTNSGATAEDVGSSGKGGVWYTTKADSFEDVVLGDQVTDSTLVPSEYTVDIKKYVSSANAGPRIQNVINFPGYKEGDGSETDPFKTLEYNKKQFYRMGEDTASNGYPATGIVYIIRHGDGVHYSKFQVDFYKFYGTTSSPPVGVSTDHYHVRYETLN